ncbi:MAG: lipocalin family protein, partial [Burkholderiaceae bacterium]
DLDARIQRAEERLVAREQLVRDRVGALRQRVRAATAPRKLVGPALGAVLALGGIGWLWRRREPLATLGSGGTSSVDGAAPQSGLAQLPWTQMMALAVPMLPTAWRSRVNPATVSTMLALGLPLIDRISKRRRVPPLATMAPPNLQRFAGTWHAVAQLPNQSRAAGELTLSMRYRLRRDGGFDLTECSRSRHGRPLRDAHGVVRPVKGGSAGQFRASLWPRALRWLPWAWSDHWIVHVDAACNEAMIGSPRRDSLWFLSRDLELPPARLQALLQIARDAEFPLDRLKFAQTERSR